VIPWWALAILIFGANFAIWGFIGLCRHVAVLIRTVRRARAIRRGGLAPVDGQAPVLAVAGSAMSQNRGPGAWGLPPLPAALAQPVLALVPAAAWQPRPRLPAPRLAADNGTMVSMRGAGMGGTGERGGPPETMTASEVAVLIAAHNEELVIDQTLTAIMELVPLASVHVVSDGSTDRTVEVARRAGANVIETKENLGKAGALQEAIERFGLLDRFRAVMLLDADTRVQPGYFDAALPMFDDPEVAAVAGCVKTETDRKLSLIGNLLVGHRQVIYSIGQRVLKYGQTSRRFNATPIVPGFASIYRSDVLPRIDMNPPGLVIEDFNMTFEVYQKDLGKVGFTLAAVAVTQDPDNFHDYIRQTKRWALGLWQTVRRHPPRANLFTAMVALLLFETVTSSLIFLVLPMLLLVFCVPELLGGAQYWPWFAPVYTAVAAHVQLSTVFFGIVVPDYALTCVVAALERRPRLLLFGFLFPLLRLVDAAIGIYAIPMAWLSRSNGRWKSPARSILGSSPVAAGGGQPGGGQPGGAGRRTLSVARLAGSAGPARLGGVGATCAVVPMGDSCHASG
jgi:glycosyltransferase involved in cell wall biosynthesis